MHSQTRIRTCMHMCVAFPLCLYLRFLYIPIIVWTFYWFPILTTSLPTIPIPTYLPVLISVFFLISFLYCVSYIPWRPLSLLVHRLSISISISISVYTSSAIPNATPVPIPTYSFHSIPTNSPSHSSACRYHTFSFFSYLSVPGYVPWSISPYNFLYQLPSIFLHSSLIYPNFTKKRIKTSIASGYSDKKYYLCSGNQDWFRFVKHFKWLRVGHYRVWK